MSISPAGTLVEFASDSATQWSSRKKSFVVFVAAVCLFNSMFSSSLPGGYEEYLGIHYNVTEPEQLVLPITMYQLGFLAGSLTGGPLSEAYGRRPITAVSYVLFVVFTLASIYAPTWACFLFFRWLLGGFASPAITVTGGYTADIFLDTRLRGRANAVLTCVNNVVPQFAPLTSGYAVEYTKNWACPLWITFGVGAISLVPILLLPETFEPAIQRESARRAKKQSAITKLDNKKAQGDTIATVLARPFRMLFCEAIVSLCSLYLALANGIFFLFFQAYPIVFEGIYGFDSALSGVMLLPIAAGGLLGLAVFLIYEILLDRARRRNEEWATNEKYQRLPLACAGGPLCAVSLFWLGWSASARTPYWTPMMAGLPFGVGFFFIQVSLNNYVADAYKTFNVSAKAAVGCSRSLGGAFLPLAAKPLFRGLGVPWATSLLAFACVGACVIPFAFIRYGDQIKARSRFWRELEEVEAKRGTVKAVSIEDALHVLENGKH